MSVVRAYDPDELTRIFDLKKARLVDFELQACCPFKHYKPDRGYYYEKNPSFAINLISGKFNCYSCSVRGVDLFTLAWRLNIDDFHYAPKVLLSGTEKQREPEIEVYQSYLEVLSSNRDAARAYLESRGIEPAHRVVNDLHLGADDSGNLIYFPILDADGKLLGWTERRLKGSPKWMMHPAGINRAGLLYAAHLPVHGPLYLVESQMDVVRLQSWGYRAVGTFGAKPNAGQIEVILELSQGAVVLVPQNDGAGESWTDYLIRGLLNRTPLFGIRIPQKYNDVADMTDQDEFRNLDEKRISRLPLRKTVDN